jgi:predicted nuclease of predicted toxin-antitoxin system
VTRLLLDQGLPRSTVEHLERCGIQANHVGAIGLSRADDNEIIEYARRDGSVVVTLDADFHTHIALSGAALPTVIRIRREGLGGAHASAVALRARPHACQSAPMFAPKGSPDMRPATDRHRPRPVARTAGRSGRSSVHGGRSVWLGRRPPDLAPATALMGRGGLWQLPAEPASCATKDRPLRKRLFTT